MIARGKHCYPGWLLLLNPQASMYFSVISYNLLDPIWPLSNTNGREPESEALVLLNVLHPH